jgi:hypothetical protein
MNQGTIIDISDQELEALIESTGREEVLARARQYGWAGKGAPKWVWKGICYEIIAERARLHGETKKEILT